MASALARDLRSIPNLITISRIVLLFVGAAFYFSGSKVLGMVLAVIAGCTDYVDGAVARATGQVTKLGEILDQFCDLCYEALVLSVAVSVGFFPPWVLLLYLMREFWVGSIRRFMAARGLNIPSNIIGKLKTNFVMWSFLPTMLSISAVLPSFEPWLTRAGRTMLGIGLALSYVSAWGYTRAFSAGYNNAERAAQDAV